MIVFVTEPASCC